MPVESETEEQAAEDALMWLADPLVWEVCRVARRCYLWRVRSGDTHYAFGPASGVSAADNFGEPPYELTVSRWDTGSSFRILFPAVEQLKAACARHAITGDWSEFLGRAEDLNWTDSRRVWTALDERGYFRIHRKRTGDSALIFRVEYRNQRLYKDLPFMRRFSLSRSRVAYPRLEDAQVACRRYWHLGEW